MNVAETSAIAAVELSDSLLQIQDENVQKLMDAILAAKKVYVAGYGRSLLMLRAVAMRLMHLGFTTYVTGDTTTPAFCEGDLMLIASGSGETSGLLSIAGRVKQYGGTLAVITINPASTLGAAADICVVVPAYTDKVENAGMKKPILPGGSMFEQAVLLLGDTMVLPLAEKVGLDTGRAFDRHANLE